MNEKLTKFEDLAEKRVNETIKKMRLVGNLANKRNYNYTEMHSKQIVDALEAELRILKNKFRSDSEQETQTFTFKH